MEKCSRTQKFSLLPDMKIWIPRIFVQRSQHELTKRASFFLHKVCGSITIVHKNVDLHNYVLGSGHSIMGHSNLYKIHWLVCDFWHKSHSDPTQMVTQWKNVSQMGKVTTTLYNLNRCQRLSNQGLFLESLTRRKSSWQAEKTGNQLKSYVERWTSVNFKFLINFF